jgi:hypothetical protein
MKVALYIGTHQGDGLSPKLGAMIIRFAQAGKYKNVTHAEAILEEYDDGTVLIGSSSMMDGGVRMKRLALNLKNWIIVDVPHWDAIKSKAWFEKHNGEKYDVRGAVASVLPWFATQNNRWFCNESISESVGFETGDRFDPSQFAAICVSFSSQQQ